MHVKSEMSQIFTRDRKIEKNILIKRLFIINYFPFQKDLPDCTRNGDFSKKWVIFDVVKNGTHLKAVLKEIIGDDDVYKQRLSDSEDLSKI